jgi:uncharacterized membrane protein YuzA (DUF378 family)
MRRRNRKLLGAFVMIGFVAIYALLAMALAQARPLLEAHGAVRGVFYVLLGIAWIFPLMPLISWMERGGD